MLWGLNVGVNGTVGLVGFGIRGFRSVPGAAGGVRCVESSFEGVAASDVDAWWTILGVEGYAPGRECWIEIGYGEMRAMVRAALPASGREAVSSHGAWCLSCIVDRAKRRR